MLLGTNGKTDTGSPALEGSVQDLLLSLCSEGARSGTLPELVSSLAERVGKLFQARSVAVWIQEKERFRMMAVTATSAEEADELRSRYLKSGFPEAEELAARVVATRQPIHAPGKGGEGNGAALQASNVIAAPFRTSRAAGALLIYSRLEQPFSAEDVDRAGALASYAGLALEATGNLRLAEQHRGRAEHLTSLALELSTSFRLADFAKNLAVRAAELLGARAAALALGDGKQLEVVSLHDPAAAPDPVVLRRLGGALSDFAAEHSQAVYVGRAEDLLGARAASALGWQDLTVARLSGAGQELLGLLCLADRGVELTTADHNLLQAVVGHASVALENTRLFEQIAQARRQWVQIFDAISDFIVVHDETFRVVRANRPLADFVGVRPSELIGLNMRALVSICGEGSGQSCPFCRPGAHESEDLLHPVLERTYLVSTSRTQGEAEQGGHTIHVLKDITDRREAERRYRELFENIQEGLFFSTPEGRFVEVNDALVAMLGYSSREELLQVDIPTQLYLSGEQRSRFQEKVEKESSVRNFEQSVRRKDGSILHTLENCFAVRDAQGRVVQYRGAILDITGLKTFQAQLVRERDFNTKILDHTQSLILVADTTGLITYANRRCFEAGKYKESELVGHRLAEFVAPPRRAVLAEALQAVLQGQQVDNLELPLLGGDGKLSQFSVNLSPMRDEQKSVNSIVAVMTDITDAAMLQAKLMHTEKMAAVGQLVSGVAHEVNNPLTAILGFADLLVDHPDVPELAKKDLRVIVQEAQRTKLIVQNLLSFARQTPPQRRPVQLPSILRRTLQLRSYDFNNHGVEIIENLNDKLPEVVGDAHQLQQVFLNILNNAYDAVRSTSRRGSIEISTAQSEGMVEVIFRDNGPGIAHPDRIFDPFFTTKEVGKGTGLGLSICYGIVHEHGGEIACRNNEGREGASFSVRLPMASQAAMVAAVEVEE
jgi:two-component system NtrC family sensor kinase